MSQIGRGTKYSPLLAPFEFFKIVTSSIVPKGENINFKSSSVVCLLNIPINSFLSSEIEQLSSVKIGIGVKWCFVGHIFKFVLLLDF